MSAAFSNKVLITTLWQCTSDKGNQYLSGFLGKARVISFLGHPTADGIPTWDIHSAAGQGAGGARSAGAAALDIGECLRPPRAVPMRAADIIRLLGGRMHGSYGLACCPAHEDRSPSLSVSDGAGGRILVKCHGGCEQRQVIDALGRLGAWPDRAGEPPPPTEAGAGAPAAAGCGAGSRARPARCLRGEDLAAGLGGRVTGERLAHREMASISRHRSRQILPRAPTAALGAEVPPRKEVAPAMVALMRPADWATVWGSIAPSCYLMGPGRLLSTSRGRCWARPALSASRPTT